MEEKNTKSFKSNSLNTNEKKLDLLKKDLEVNIQEQVIVNKRIMLLKESMQEIPNTNPDYVILITQHKMDLIELDELKSREEDLKTQIISFGN
ncbi:MAG: hypothetical protein K1060chlam5_00585 [Candidatus Anoxychlamydiales bacterium]|nr:hypothetical protein [Candidatus Anoxychlamydiales bacterium]